MNLRTTLLLVSLVLVPATASARPPGLPSYYGYPLDEPVGGYFGGGRYTEYYGYGHGYGIANFPGSVPYYPGYDYWLGPQTRRNRQPVAVVQEPTPVHVVVWVPANAEVCFDGHKTTQAGEGREFVSTPLPPGERMTYTVRATWPGEDGKAVEQEQLVSVMAGERVVVRFPMAP